MQFRAERGCGSKSANSTFKFLPIPETLIPRARGTKALNPRPKGSQGPCLQIDCGKLMSNAVSKPFENGSPNNSDKDGSSGELVACRVCLAAAGRLYALNGSGIEDSLAKLTGLTVANEKRFPRYICAFCLAKLSKCAAFRDSCQRSTAVLQTLLETGRLKMNIIKAIDRRAHKLGNNLTSHKVIQLETGRLLYTPAAFKTEAEDSNDGADCTEVEYLDTKDSIKLDSCADNGEEGTFEMESSEEESTFGIENLDSNSKITGDTDVANVARDVDKEPSSLKLDTHAEFGEKYNFKVKRFSKKEQKQKVEERKRDNKTEFCCDICGKGCASARGLRTHNTDCHNPDMPFVCDVCGCRFRHGTVLRKHQVDHGALLTCKQCEFVAHRRVVAINHYFDHEGRKYTCPHCPAQFSRKSTYFLHVKMRHPADNEACDECGETFNGASGLRTHRWRQHRKIAVNSKCTVCKVKFLSAEALQRHEELSVGVSHAALFPCGACGDSCGSDAARAAHMVDKHPPDQHYCEECDKTFSSAAAFALHVDRKHKNIRPKAWSAAHGAARAAYRYRARAQQRNYVCERCGKKLLCAATLEYHMNMHLGLTPFQCTHCPKAFNCPLKLRLHLRRHTGERPYQCEHCPRAFTMQGNYRRHVKNVHLRERVNCDKCGKQVGEASLAAHIRAVHMNIPVVRRKRDRPKKRRDPGTES